MSEISEAEIKAMTKEQNYIRGYKDGKSDVLDKIRAEIEKESAKSLKYPNWERAKALIDKYRAESEGQV